LGCRASSRLSWRLRRLLVNDHQEHRQEALRRRQILGALEDQANRDLAAATAERDRLRKIFSEFKRALEAGEMPPLKPFAFNTDYSATDVATLLQSGGYQLLDIKTLVALHELETVLRNGIGTMTHAQQLSDALIVPNLDQDIAFFYDPATKKLRIRFTRYTLALDSFDDFYEKYVQAETDLLAQIHAEQQKR
jgi:hypothetical protein